MVFTEHRWSGRVEVGTLDEKRWVNLLSADQRKRVVEVRLPSASIPTPVTITLLDHASPGAAGNQAWIHGAYVDDCQAAELPGRIAGHSESPPFDLARVNQLTDCYKWYEPAWTAARDALRVAGDYTPPDYVHRKSWEWVQTIYGLDWLGMLRADHRALGVGVGWEPLSFFFSNLLDEVVATDLYALDDEWTSREGSPKILEDPDPYAPYPYRKNRLRFLRMDGRSLDFPNSSFDVVWSCSSIEHFGGHVGAQQAMLEIERVLRPGGVASVITEYVLPDLKTGDLTTFDPEYFNMRAVYDLVRCVPSLRLVQPVDFSFPDYYQRRSVLLPEESQTPHGGMNKPHVALRAPNGSVITSIALFFRKRGGRRWGPGRLVAPDGAS